MSERIRALKARDVIFALKKMGFFKVRQKGAHICFKHADGRFTLVPSHAGEDIGRGLLRQIMREAEVSPKEFMRYLRK